MLVSAFPATTRLRPLITLKSQVGDTGRRGRGRKWQWFWEKWVGREKGLGKILNVQQRDFPSNPVVKSLGLHFRGLSFEPWSGN